MIRKQWGLLAAGVAAVFAAVVFAEAQGWRLGAQQAQWGPRGGPPPGMMRPPVRRTNVETKEKVNALLALAQVIDLPEGRALYDKHDKTVKPLMKQVRDILNAARKAQQTPGGEAPTDTAKTQLQPVAEQLTEARLQYCEELVKLARKNKEYIASKYVSESLNDSAMMGPSEGPPGGPPGGAPGAPPGGDGGAPPTGQGPQGRDAI